VTYTSTHLLTALFVLAPTSAFGQDGIEFFENRIRPVLTQHCYECHSAASDEAGGELLLDSRDGLLKGGESGPAVVPGNPKDSLLLEALRHESLEMPPNEKLPDTVIADFDQWIRDGAVDPRDKSPSPTDAAASAWKAQLAERSRWWSLQPPRSQSPPRVTNDIWSKEPVDRFVLSALDRAGLSPAEPAGAEVMLRRLAFVLTGLPPQPEQVKEFSQAFADDANAALARLVDDLLASPHFGERFARHWMDVVRYTDTYGYEWDNPAKGAWEYRDYLIRAFNDDVGFDQLIREQIAGDLLPHPRINKQAGVNESIIGPMFYHMGEHRHGDSLAFNGIHQEMVNNKIDAFSKTFLAMTVACARCHDHKLDAISQADYYALAGVFMTPRWTTRSIDVPGKNDEAIVELTQLRDQIQKRMGEVWTSPVKPWVTGSSLRHWANEHASSLQSTTVDEISWPLAQLFNELDLPESRERSDDDVVQTWDRLKTKWRTARDSRRAANADKFTLLCDFLEPGLPDEWSIEGTGITHGYVSAGTMLVNLSGETVMDRVLHRGYHTHALSSKFSGAVRLPPQNVLPAKHVSLRLRGGEWAGHMVVPQNAFQTESITFLDATAPVKWITFSDRVLTNGVTRVLPELMTASLHPNFPPRTGLARAGKVTLSARDNGFDKRSWFSLTGIVTHDVAGSPVETLEAFSPLFEGDAPASGTDAWQRIAGWFSQAIGRWAANDATAGDVEVINWLLQENLLPNQAKTAPDIASLVTRYREVEEGLAYPRSVNSMDERGMDPLNYRLNIRGNVDEEGSAIPRSFLEVFAGKHRVAESPGSGRLELAEYLSETGTPQTARVYVNRVWQSVFGRGIVATPGDFGKLGDRPSHPGLLDWLSSEFMREGWSTKKLIRRLVLSQTFRQSGTITRAAATRDPDNRWLHHYPTRRLEAEAIRDSLLVVSGRFDSRLYGPPIDPPRTVEDAAKRLFSGPVDSDGRRSIYMKMSIMDPPKFLVCFNLPDLKLPTGRRDVTNGPAHALALLNAPLVIQLSDHWAERLLYDGVTKPEDRVHAMFIRALGRAPAEHELQRWTTAVTGFSQSDELMNDKTAWSELAHLFFNTKEFIYYR
jgi:Protein of unknown function (DUF1553)/Protein of unknown function (DUF1549)/Planctomycete cytochrome C